MNPARSARHPDRATGPDPVPGARSGGVGVTALVAVLVLLAAACGSRPESTIATAVDLRGARFVVGGGPTGELELLCQLTVAAVEAAGATASDQCARYGALDVRLPAERSFVDTGWGYPSRADRDLDGRDDPPASLDAVARADAARGLTWLPPAVFSDTEALVVPGPVADGRTRASGATGRTPGASGATGRTPGASGATGRTPGASGATARTTVSELALRPGTWCLPPGAATARLLAAYRPVAATATLDGGAAVVGVARGTCTVGLVPNTSGYIPALGLRTLVDDRGALGGGGAAPVLRSDVVSRHPGVRTVLGLLTPRLTDDVMRALNREVGQSGRDARDVAREWLDDQGLV